MPIVCDGHSSHGIPPTWRERSILLQKKLSLYFDRRGDQMIFLLYIISGRVGDVPGGDAPEEVMYSQACAPTPSTTAIAPLFRTAKRSPARPAAKSWPPVAP